MRLFHSSETRFGNSSVFDRILVGLCLVFLLSGMAAVNDLCIYTPDSARYMIWANSLARFDGYIDRTVPDPERYVIHAPLYSLLLAPVERLFPNSFLAAKAVTLLFGALALVVLYRWLSKAVNKGAALSGCLVLAFNPMFFIHSTEVLSDIPFAACLILFFLLLERIAPGESPSGRTTAALILTVGAGILLREVGISLLVSACFFFVLRRDYKRALLLLAALIPYLLWLYRNEVVVAGIEAPTLTNAKLFRSHFFAPADDFFLREYAARIATNAGVYGEIVGGLLFFPTYIATPALLISKFDPAVAGVQAVLQYGKYLLGPCTVAFALAGLVRDVRGSQVGKARLVFLLLYLFIILLYPINDRRFLLPLLIVMIFYFMRTSATILEIRGLSGDWKVPKRTILFALLAAAIAPGAIWTARYIANSISYNQSPEAFYEQQRALEDYPWHFTKLFRAAGSWIGEHTGPSAVCLAQWKDLACWTGGRRLVPADQTVSLDDFENTIRDYGIGYIIAMVSKNEIREFEFQMHQSRRYGFTLRSRMGNVEIYSVAERNPSAGVRGGNTRFSTGLALLEEKKYREAEDVFDEILTGYPGNITPQFYKAVCREFSMKLDEADSLFGTFRSFGQAGMFIQEAAAHRRLIALLRPGPSPEERYFRVGAGYWNMGFRAQAKSLMEKSLEADSAFTPAQIFSIYFALQQGDTASSKSSFRKLRSSDPGHPMTPVWSRIFLRFDTLRANPEPAKGEMLFKLSTDFAALGLADIAVDNLLLSLRERPDNVEGLLLLANLSLSKRHFEPARQAVERVLALDKGNLSAQSLSRVISRRLYLSQ